MNWYDSHCHMANLAKRFDFMTTVKSAEEKGINGWLSCALSMEEVRWHQININPKIKFSAGIHPLYDEGTPLTLVYLEELIKNKHIFAIGEIGLDKRNFDLKNQISVLKDQLSLARCYDLPVVFHVVGHYDVLFDILNDLPVKGIWHGFYGSKETVKQFSKFDITFSIGHTLVNSLKHEVINAIINYGNYLIETDAPYNLNKSDKTGVEPLNPLTKIISYAHIISKLNGVKLQSLNVDIMNNSKQYFV